MIPSHITTMAASILAGSYFSLCILLDRSSLAHPALHLPALIVPLSAPPDSHSPPTREGGTGGDAVVSLHSRSVRSASQTTEQSIRAGVCVLSVLCRVVSHCVPLLLSFHLHVSAVALFFFFFFFSSFFCLARVFPDFSPCIADRLLTLCDFKRQLPLSGSKCPSPAQCVC